MKTYCRMLPLMIFLAVCPFRSKAVSMGEVIGQVIEKETLKPVAFAEIILENNMDKITVSANEYGYYYAVHVPTGRYQIRVVYNNRVFVMNKIRVYDSYSSEINFVVSNNKELPATVELPKKDPLIDPMETHDIKITSSNDDRATHSLTELLMAQPGLDVRDGRLFVKGTSKGVRFFIDGSPVMESPELSGW